MDAKITLSFNADVIDKAKQYAERNNMSLSRMTEYLFQKLTKNNYASLEDLPLADWVNTLAEGPAEYKRSTKKDKEDYYNSRKK